jgi:hypothetical protein
VNVGDIVHIKDDTSPRNMWPMGKVTKTEPDSKGLVRIVEVKTKDTQLRRPVQKLVLLPSTEDKP